MPQRTDTTEAYELRMDALLGIRTTGRDESHATQDSNPYEPTPYAVLERLANSGLTGKRNLLVDYGCGKGRVGLYLAYQARCRSIGVERDPLLLEAARRNHRAAPFLRGPHAADRVAFELADAAAYDPPQAADRFYFFNPFSVEVFAQVLERIRRSLADAPRTAAVLLYYPDDAYLGLLAQTHWLAADPDAYIDCRNLFGGGDPRETVLVYRAG